MMKYLKLALLFALTASFGTVPLRAQAPESPYQEARKIIADLNRIVTPNGVQESLTVELGGTRQWVTIRGTDREHPILLFVHGGPAAPETPFLWAFQRPWEDFFTVVQWDQRAAGKSWPLNEPGELVPDMKLERYVDDAIELIEFLRQRFGKRKIILLGHSWGSAVGMTVARKRPDLLHAYVGAGQIINARRGEAASYDWTLEKAREAENAGAIRELEALAPYPAPGPFDVTAMTTQRKWNIRFGGLYGNRSDVSQYFKLPRLSPEYEPEDIKSWGKGSDFSIRHLWPVISEVNFDEVRRLDVPVYMFNGRHDYTTPAPLAADWLRQVNAPKKANIWFEHSAHLMMISEPGRMLQALLKHARPLAVEAGDGEPID